jgi:hypothetical protein
LCCRRPEQDDEARPDGLDLCFEPRFAGADLLGVRLLVQASFAPAHPPEVLHRVGHVDAAAVDSSFREGPVE